MINPGLMRHHIFIQRDVSVPDDSGGRVHDWHLVADTWAEIDTVQGKEAYRYARLQPDMTHLFRVRYNEDIMPNQEIMYRQRRFRILTVQNIDYAMKELVLLTREIQP